MDRGINVGLWFSSGTWSLETAKKAEPRDLHLLMQKQFPTPRIFSKALFPSGAISAVMWHTDSLSLEVFLTLSFPLQYTHTPWKPSSKAPSEERTLTRECSDYSFSHLNMFMACALHIDCHKEGNTFSYLSASLAPITTKVLTLKL